MRDAGGAGREAPASWWGLVVAGVAFIALGVGSYLAYSYWGWDGRGTGMIFFGPILGISFIVWGIGKGARQAVHRMRLERAATHPPDPLAVD
ncbi:hypothetical protein [Frigoribacterium endophyticum]|uniref:hypothetical protein n=1 Tax=Frigoribacterium endophyticum TaxID=1522176 RepID=UPI00142232D5|nr:hypothetical protein [Frigoribacterium endophyticum]NII51267.1 cytochrome c biogenesis factor [Frigoribacterium endophyticum]